MMLSLRILLLTSCAGWIVFGRNCLATESSEAPDCSDAVTQVVDCLQFVTGQATSPSQDCCSGVEKVRQTTPACLCEFVEDNGPTSAIPDYQPDLAKQLPRLCNMEGSLNVSICQALLGQPSTNAPTAEEGAAAPMNLSSKSGGHRVLMWASMPSPRSIVLMGLKALVTFVVLYHHKELEF